MNEQASTDSKQLRKGPPSVKSWLWGLAMTWVALLVVERIAPSTEASRIFSSQPGQGLIVIAILILGFLIWRFRDFLWRGLPTIDFSISIMGVLLLATVFGTIILQDQGRDRLTEIYGSTAAAFIIGLGLDHIFHSYWFGAFLLLFAMALVLVAVKKRMWQTPKLGYLMAHLGVVVIIAGGFIGFTYGSKGTMDLFEGKSSNQVHSFKTLADGSHTLELPFSILLEDFDIEWYPGGYRFYVYKRSGGRIKVTKSIDPKEATGPQKLPGGAVLSVKEVFPDYYEESKLVEVPAGQGAPALALTLDLGGHSHEVPFFAQPVTSPAVRLTSGTPPVRFVWDPPTEAQLAALGETTGSGLVVSYSINGSQKEAPVDVGGKYLLSGGKYELTVLEYQPDFVYDMDTHQAGSRSDQPNNPALRVVMSADGVAGDPRWLFAKNPDFSMAHNQTDELGLRFIFKSAAGPAPHELIVVGKTRELIKLTKGQVTKREPLPAEPGLIPELSVSSYRILPSAQEQKERGTRSQEWNNALVVVELSMNGSVTEKAMMADSRSSIALPDGKSFLVFEDKEPEAKSYRSKLAVMVGDLKAKEQTIAVNNPLSCQGWSFYQSNYRKEDPTYSGLLVVRDPGLWIVYLGFIMISVGVIFAAYVRPRLLKRRKADA